MKLENFRSICWLLLGWTCGVFGQNENTNGRWSDPVPFGIVPVAVANLPDGRLICWSSQFRNTFIGNGDGATFTELFDPFVGTDGQALGEFTSNTDHDMFCPGINNLADGRILAAGGTSSERTSIYDWRTGVWSVADEMNIPRGYQGNVTLPNGSVFTVGGSWSGGAWTNRDAEIWTSASGWQLLPGIKGDDFYTFNDLLGDSQSPLYRADNHIWLWPAPDGNLFHAGPSRQMHWINTSGNGTMIAAGARGNDSFSMKGTTVMFDVGKILKVGGAVSYDDGDPANNTSYVIDINSGYGNNPTVTATSNTLTFARTMHNSTVLPNGQVLVTGGISDASLFTDTGARLTAELYDPTTNSWTTVAGMQTPRTYHSVAILMVDGRVFVGGGGLCDSTPGCVNHFDAEIYSPPYLFDSGGNLAQRPVISAPSVANYNTSVPVTGSTGIQSFSLVRFSAATHSTNNEQRRIPVSFSSFGQSYSVNIPNQNLLPPGYYMLFAIDGNGVPSIAETIQIGQGLQDPQNNDLLVQLDFEENAGITVSDSAGNNDFTVAERNDNGAPVTANDHQWKASGVFGDALELDGKFHTSNTLLELPYNNDIAQLEDAVTVTAWVWRDAGSIVSQTGRPANVAVFAHDYPAIFAGFHNSLLKWSFGTTEGFVDCYAGHAPLNQWMHIAVTYDGRDAKLYSNGIEICSKPIRGKIRLRNDSSPNSRFTISGFYEHRTNLPVVPYGNRSGITDEVDGRIDDFRIYKTALSETEIQSIYNLGLIAYVPGISDCSTQRIVPEYKIGPNGQWREGNVIEALEGSQVFIRAKNYPGEYFITTPQYDGPTFSSVNSTSRLTAEGAYQVDTYVYHFNNPERNDGLIDRSNVGQFALTTTGGCSTVINLQLEISNENCETEIIPEYRLNGVWQSGENDLTVELGTEVVLSMLPNTISVEIELPSGQTVGDNFSLGQVTAVDSGTYKLISEEGCIDFINLTVNDPNGNQPPIANATGSPLSGTFPLLVNFNGGGSTDDTGISSYSWDFGDGNGSSSTSPSHTYTAAGSYTATLTVTDAEGLTDSDTVTITVTGGSIGGCDPLTAPWASQDIGGVGQAGSSCYDASTGIYEIEGSGSDIWGTSDEFHYAYQTLEGDGEIVARVLSMESTDAWAKAGIMFRSDLGAGSAMALLSMHPNPRGQGPSYSLQHRSTTNGTMSSSGNNIGPVASSFPRYLRLVRSGDQISAYTSSTNGNWSLLGSRTIQMPNTIYVGLAVTSHDDSTLNLSEFDSVSVQGDSGGGGPVNQPPVANAAGSPLSGTFPLLVDFDGSGSTDDTGISSYSWDFGDGNGSSSTSPSHTYTTAGSYTATLTVTDAEGLTDSDTVTITVTGGGGPVNQPPVANATGSPLSGTFPLLVNFNGGGSTDDAGISSYSWDFGDGNGSSSTSPSHTYTAAGSYTATLTVTDAEGLTDSDTVTITVTGGSGGGCDPLTAPWASQDIGGVGQAGSSCYDASTGIYEIEGSGSDIWGTSDEFHYAYQTLEGDGEIVARVLLMESTDAWAKAGIMFRSDLGAGSAMALLSMHPNPRGQGPSYSLQHRSTTNGTMSSSGNNIGPVASSFPRYLRLVRSGDEIAAYTSSTNGNWSLLGSRTIQMPNTIYVGLAVTSHDDSTLNLSEFDSVSVQGDSGGGGPVNQPPVANAAGSPLSGTFPLLVDFDGSGSTDDTGISSYSWDFGDGNGSSSTSPSHTYTAAGSYTATLTVTDAEGLTDSDTVTITVTGGSGGGCDPLTAPWASQDIGGVGQAGSSCYDASTGIYEIEGSGSDIWGTSDEFHYAYQTLEGDGEIVARVLSMESTDAWAKAGIMFRSDLGAGSAMALLSMHPNPRGQGPSYSLQHRSTTNGTMSSSGNNIGPVASSFPRYLRLVRSGDEIAAYTSSTNGNWSLLGSRTIQMPNTIYVGLAVTSHDDGTLNLSEFDSVSVQPNTNSFQSNISDFDGFAGISSAKANTSDNIVLTPNPTSDFVDVALPSDGNITRIRVYGYNGRLLQTVETNDLSKVSVYTLDVRELPTGIYIINVLNDLGQMYEARFIIQR